MDLIKAIELYTGRTYKIIVVSLYDFIPTSNITIESIRYVHILGNEKPKKILEILGFGDVVDIDIKFLKKIIFPIKEISDIKYYECHCDGHNTVDEFGVTTKTQLHYSVDGSFKCAVDNLKKPYKPPEKIVILAIEK